MRALHRLGASTDALAVYAAHRTALAEELGLDPAPELVEAQRQVLARVPAMPEPPSPAPRTPPPAVAARPRRARWWDATPTSTRSPG